MLTLDLSAVRGEQVATPGGERECLVLEGQTDPLTVDDALLEASVIEIRFSAFHDGRGLSLARYLRLNKKYSGYMRAVGWLLPDQLSLIVKLGFDEIVVDEATLGRHGEADWLTAYGQLDVSSYQESGARSIWQQRCIN